jgi:hypothetical protein
MVITSFILIQAAHGLIDTLEDIAKHAIYLSDLDSRGNSMSTFHTLTILECGCEVIHLLLILIENVIYIGLSNNVFLLILLLHGVYIMMKRFTSLRTWLRTFHDLGNALPQPTEEQIRDPCIICRGPMQPADSRVLPCGHCCHLNCIIQWVRHQAKCPLCGHDLSHLADAPAIPAPVVEIKPSYSSRDEVFDFEFLADLPTDEEKGGEAERPKFPVVVAAVDKDAVQREIEEHEEQLRKLREQLGTE